MVLLMLGLAAAKTYRHRIAAFLENPQSGLGGHGMDRRYHSPQRFGGRRADR